MRVLLLTALTTSMVLFAAQGCDSDGDGDAGGDIDVDSDGDGDGDNDADTDADLDADGDAGTDAAVDADADPDALALLHPITVEELHAVLAQRDVLLVCVHIPYAGQIPGTDAHIPYTDLDALAEYIGDDLDREVVLYCLTGPMSTAAGGELVARGYRQVFDLQGGMNAWEAAGYELEQ